MQKDDTLTMTCNAYIADCLGMITRQLYGTKDLKLYTDLVDIGNTQEESADSVKKKILKMLGVGQDGFIQSGGEIDP